MQVQPTTYRAPVARSTGQSTPAAASDHPSQVWTKDEMVNVATSLAPLGNSLRPGESLSVSLSGDKIQINKDGPPPLSIWASFKSATKDVVGAAGDVVSQDPSLAFREAVEAGAHYFLPADHPNMTQQIMGAMVPATRAVCLALDIRRANKSLHTTGLDPLFKVTDAAHVATDVAGLVGSAEHLVPALSAIPAFGYMSIAGVVGDLTAFGVHTLQYMQTFSATQASNHPPGGPTQNGPSGPTPPAPPTPPPGTVKVTLQG